MTPAEASEFTFYVRIPGWAESAQVSVNGKPVTGAKPGEYLALSRKWAAGDVVHLKMEMTPQVIEANPHVVEDAGRVAVQRGPLVYCLEQLDQPSGTALADVALDVGRKTTGEFRSEFKPDLLGGVVVLEHPGASFEYSEAHDALYSKYTPDTPKNKPVALTFIPYYAWANREATPMQVWTPLLKA
jgi:DUF1680 family protein